MNETTTVTRMEPTDQEAAAIGRLLAAPYPVTLDTVAKELGCTPLAAAQKMPEANVRFVTGDAAGRFDDIWAELAGWQKVTLFIVHAGHVFEVQTKLSPGKRAQGWYNILSKDAVVGGHLQPSAIAACAFVSMPFMGRESHSVQFFDALGQVAFSVYAGRENHRLIQSVVEAFQAAKARFCA